MDKTLLKKYGKISLTLGVIAGGAALLISSLNLLTGPVIEKNEEELKQVSIKNLYGENSDPGKELFIDAKYQEDYKAIKSYFDVKVNDKYVGSAFIMQGSNSFGRIQLAVAIGSDASLGRISLIVNEQTLPKPVNRYVDEVNLGVKGIEDVKCGATYGATLVKDLAKTAQKYYKEVILDLPEAPAPAEKAYVNNTLNINYVDNLDKEGK